MSTALMSPHPDPEEAFPMLEEAHQRNRWRPTGAAGLAMAVAGLLLLVALRPVMTSGVKSQSVNSLELAEQDLKVSGNTEQKDIGSWQDDGRDEDEAPRYHRKPYSKESSVPCDCDFPLSPCDGQCANFQTDPLNCGGCGKTCRAGSVCIGGSCKCPARTTKCSGWCVDTKSDSDNCGGCNLPCSGNRKCILGSCQCPPSFSVCGGQCVNYNDDSSNCGACRNACAGGAVCQSSSCQCPAAKPQTCSGICVDVKTDVQNCGTCGTTCPGDSNCLAGLCVCKNPTKYLVADGYWPPVQNNIILTDDQLPSSGSTVAYTYAFWVMLFSATTPTTGAFNILRKGGYDAGDLASRNPGIFLTSGAAPKVQLRIGVANTGASVNSDSGVDSSVALQQFQWTHVAVTVEEGRQYIYYDGVDVTNGGTTFTNIQRNAYPLYSSDTWYAAFLGLIGDLKYANSALTQDQVQSLACAPPAFPALSPVLFTGPLRVPAAVARVIARNDELPIGFANSYTYMFRLKMDTEPPQGFPRNVLHKGNKDDVNGGRAPAFYALNTGSGTLLQVAFYDTSLGDAQCNSQTPLPVGQWLHVAVTVMKGLQITYYDGVEQARTSFSSLQSNDAPLYINAPGSAYNGMDGSVADIRYESRFLTPTEIQAAQAKCPCPDCGFLQLSSSCVACPAGCKSCSSATFCTSCFDGTTPTFGGVCGGTR